jgi:hypothetical protein
MPGLVVYQPPEMVNHFFPAPPAPPAKPPDRDKLIINWLDSPSLGEEPSMQPRLSARNHIQPRPSTRYNKPYGLTRPSCLILTLAVKVLVLLACDSTAEAIRSEPETAKKATYLPTSNSFSRRCQTKFMHILNLPPSTYSSQTM